MKKISEQIWTQVQTDYQLGIGVRELERKYEIAKSTIDSRRKKEEWIRSDAKLAELQRAAENFAQDFGQNQLPFVQTKVNEIFDLQTKVRSFINTAIEVNLKNIHAVNNEPDDITRIKMTSMMRANMVDLASINTSVKEADKQDEQEDKVINVIIR